MNNFYGMVKSMTGYGKATLSLKQGSISVEIKSLNGKILDVSVRLPKEYASQELFLRNECNRCIERGKASVTISLDYHSDADYQPFYIDQKLLKQCHTQLKESADSLHEHTAPLFQLALTLLPEVIKPNNEAFDPKIWNAILETWRKASSEFDAFRLAEGSVLSQELVLRINSIAELLTQVDEHESTRLPSVRKRLHKYLKDATDCSKIDQSRLEQELVFYAEKFDITEEKVRLKSHCDYFLVTLKQANSNGKKLGFIGQEIGREINTLGSKANDAHIQKLVISMKEALEKIKEQLFNIL